MLYIEAKLKKIQKTEYTNKDWEIKPKIELVMVTEWQTQTVYIQETSHKIVSELEEGKKYKIPVKTFVKSWIKNGTNEAYWFLNISLNATEQIEEL